MFVSRRVKYMGAPTAAIFTYYDLGSESTNWYFELWEYDEENEIYIRMKTDSSHSVYTLADTFTTNTWTLIALTYQRSTGYHRGWSPTLASVSPLNS